MMHIEWPRREKRWGRRLVMLNSEVSKAFKAALRQHAHDENLRRKKAGSKEPHVSQGTIVEVSAMRGNPELARLVEQYQKEDKTQ